LFFFSCRTKTEGMHEYLLMLFAYQNDATAKQAIGGKNKQIFTLKENDIYTKLEWM